MAITSPLPVKNGVSPNRLWLPEGSWGTMLDFFQSRFPHLTLEDCLTRFRQEEVRTSAGEVLSEKSVYQASQHLFFYRELQDELKIPFKEKIIYQDEKILVADKPHFLPVTPTGQYLHETLLVRLRKTTKIDTLELCHRLDRETAGILLLTKKPCFRDKYHQLFAARAIKKIYLAIVPKPQNPHQMDELPIRYQSKMIRDKNSMRMREIIGNPNSETLIKLIEKRTDELLLELSPITGRKHQLRLHLASLGMPIKNDPLYPTRKTKLSSDFEKPLQLLAKSLAFVDPFDGSERQFTSQLTISDPLGST